MKKTWRITSCDFIASPKVTGHVNYFVRIYKKIYMSRIKKKLATILAVIPYGVGLKWFIVSVFHLYSISLFLF